MKPNFFFTKLTGSPSGTSTTQIHEIEVKGGKLFILITCKDSSPNLTRMESIRGVVNFIHHWLSENQFDFQAFKEEVGKTFVPTVFSGACIYKLGKVVYIVKTNEISAKLIRRATAFDLFDEGKALDSVSGELKEGDLLVVETKEAKELLAGEIWQEYFAKKNLLALESDFSTKIQGLPDPGLVGAMSVSFGEPEQLPLEEELEEALELSPDSSETHTEEKVEEVLPPQEPVPESFPEPSLTTHFPDINRATEFEAKSKSKKGAALGLLLILLLGVGIFIGSKVNSSKKEKELVEKTILNAQASLKEARALSLSNKTKARELIYGARENVNRLENFSDKYPQVKGISDEIKDSLGEVGGIYEDAPTSFTDLSLITKDSSADALTISDDVLFVLSIASQRITSFELPGKRTETVFSGNMNGPINLASYVDRVFALENDGVYEYDGSRKKVISVDSVGDNMLIKAFAGNIYLLSPGENAIYRFPGTVSGFGEKSLWISQGVDVDLSKSVSWAIDGSIWVLSGTGRLTRFMLGNPQNVTLNGLPAVLSERSSIYTSEDSLYLYVLDPAKESVFVFTKEGDLEATYSNPALSGASKLVVSEKNKLILLPVGSKVLSLEARHLR